MMLRTKFPWVLLGIALLLPQTGFSIGVVGNNKLVDSEEGFSAKLPKEFDDVHSGADRSAVLNSSVNIGQSAEGDEGDSGLHLAISAAPLSVGWTALQGKSLPGMQDYLRAKFGFVTQPLLAPQCVGLLVGENAVGYIGVAQWSGGRGYVLTVQKDSSGLGKEGILGILQSTVVDSPCRP